MAKIALNQSDFRSPKSAMSQEKVGQSEWFLTCWDRLKEDKRWFENLHLGKVKIAINQSDFRSLKAATETDWRKIIWKVSLGRVKNVLTQSDYRILESTISQVRIDESTWFVACKYRFKKLVKQFVSFWLSVVKKCSPSMKFGILTKSSISQEQLGYSAWFLTS